MLSVSLILPKICLKNGRIVGGNPETQPQTEPETQPLTTQPETEPETIPETAPETLPETEPESEGKHSKAWIPWVLGVAAVALAIGIRHMLSYKPQHAKKRKK